MPLTLQQLVDAGFAAENFPTDLPSPGPETLTMESLDGKKELYRYDAAVEGQHYAMEIVVDRETLENPGEGVNFMLNQFAYLWRMDRPKVQIQDGQQIRRIEF